MRICLFLLTVIAMLEHTKEKKWEIRLPSIFFFIYFFVYFLSFGVIDYIYLKLKFFDSATASLENLE